MSLDRLLRIALCLFAPVLAPAAERGQRESISEAALTSHVRYLASDELGGRGVGTPGIDLAAAYIAERFEDCGLLPGGDEGSYFQSFEISGNWGELTIHDQPLQASLYRDFISLRTETAEASFDAGVVFAGYGIVNPDRHYDDFAGLDVEGKILLIFRREPQGWDSPGDHTSHAAFATKARLASERGAAAVLFVNPPRGDADTLLFRGTWQQYPLPMIHVSRKLADLILRAGGFSDLRTLHDWIARGRRVGGPLNALRISGNVARRPFKTKNVIGILPAEGPVADEYVVFGAHYDHLGTVPPTRRPIVGYQGGNPGDEIHNGADDNASGTAGVVELARVFSASGPPKRSLVFMAFSGEEVGLNGSRYYVKYPTVAIENVVAMFNLDMVGRLEEDALEVAGTQTGEEFEAILDRHARSLGLDLHTSGGGSGPSDHTSFFDENIPVLFFFTGLHGDYHLPGDDSDKLDYVGLVGVLRLVEAVATDVIAMDDRPTFKAVSGRARGGAPIKVRMGIMPSYSDSTEGQDGWAIDGVVKDGPAARAGMRLGDRILRINDHPIRDIRDYMKALKDNDPGDVVAVAILRDGEEITVQVELQGR